MSAPFNFKNVQGDIIIGLPKKVQLFVFFQIADPALFQKEFTAIVPLITTTADVLNDMQKIAEHKKAHGKGPLLQLVGTNVAFSNIGLGIMQLNRTNELSLSLPPATFADVFPEGQLADAAALGDTFQADGKTPAWDPVFLGNIDGVFLITGDCDATVNQRREKIEAILHKSINVVETLRGAVRPGDESGHEHFGFKDGISNPFVTGVGAPSPGLAPIDPGILVLGTGTDSRTTPLAKEGSFLAFRKLQQFVPEFDDFLATAGAGFLGLPGDQGPTFLGARLVGRWQSGAPIALAPLKDDPALGADPNKNNDFTYSPQDQTACPFAAHLRKTNPRDLRATTGVDTAVDPHRIIRQGIPYGPEVTQAEKAAKATKIERGLAFVSYQSQLSNGFSFVQKLWSDNIKFPFGKTSDPTPGFDPIIGQAKNASRTMNGFNPQDPTKDLTLSVGTLTNFVQSRGGEYFFSPSISALSTLVAKA